MGKWLRRLAYLLRQSRHDRELREEIEAHRSLRAAHLEREGLTPQDANDASRRAIGNVLLAREDVREIWVGAWPTFWQDVRYGLRTLRKNALFTVVAVVTLALGIGVNTGIFTVLNGVLFRDLPAPYPHELVSISQTVEGGQFTATAGFDTFTISEYTSIAIGLRRSPVCWSTPIPGRRRSAAMCRRRSSARSSAATTSPCCRNLRCSGGR
jgi:hypothetical protein